MGPDLPYAGGKFPSFEGGAVLKRSTLNLKVWGIKSNVRRFKFFVSGCGLENGWFVKLPWVAKSLKHLALKNSMLFPETLFKNLADLLDAQCIKGSGRHLYGFYPYTGTSSMNNLLSTGRIWVGHSCCWPSPCVQFRQSYVSLNMNPRGISTGRGVDVDERFVRLLFLARGQHVKLEKPTQKKPVEKEKIGWVLEAFRSPMQWFVPIALECKHNMTGFQFLAMPEGQAVPLLGRTILTACYVNAHLLATRLLPPGWMETGQEESKTGPLSVGIIMARFFNLSFFQIARSKIFYIYLYIHIYVYLKGIKDRYVLVCKHVLYETFFVEKAAGW